jgi:hypothetical protein
MALLRPGTLRVDLDSNGLSDLLIAFPPDQNGLGWVIEHTPNDPRWQPRHLLAVDAQLTGEAATAARLRLNVVNVAVFSRARVVRVGEESSPGVKIRPPIFGPELRAKSSAAVSVPRPLTSAPGPRRRSLGRRSPKVERRRHCLEVPGLDWERLYLACSRESATVRAERRRFNDVLPSGSTERAAHRDHFATHRGASDGLEILLQASHAAPRPDLRRRFYACHVVGF